MNKKIYTITDLGGGDGGKGSVVHKICALRHPHTVIKVGGAQGSHGVDFGNGKYFSFSQFGCGTYEGIKTFISKNFVINLFGIIGELNALRYQLGISNPNKLLTIDENALCATPYHSQASKIRELSLKNNPRNIIAIGTGEAFQDSKKDSDIAFTARDLKGNFKNKLQKIREYKLSEMKVLMNNGFLESDSKLAKLEFDYFSDQKYFDCIVDQFTSLAKQLTIVDGDYLKKNILNRDGVAVVESSHGVLTDYLKGFSPHTSRLRTLPEITSWSLLEENRYDGEVIRLGVTRAHQIKHGAGPMVVDDELMTKALYGGTNDLENPDRYRGKVRVGPLDTVMLRYAINVAGGSQKFDGICLTWFDSMVKLGTWPVCYSYNNTDPKYFSDNGDILVKECGSEEKQIAYQTNLTQSLRNCTPNVNEYHVSQNTSKEVVKDLCATALQDRLGVPIRMIGLGPTENEKILI